MCGSVSDWDVERVRRWLEDGGFSSYTALLCDRHRLDGNCLLMLSEQDLKQPPLEIKVSSHSISSNGIDSMVFICNAIFNAVLEAVKAGRLITISMPGGGWSIWDQDNSTLCHNMMLLHRF